MAIPSLEASVQDRLEYRTQVRNLDNFLNYSFDHGKKLGLLDEKIHGNAIKVLKEIDLEQIDWKSYPSLWYNDTLNLKNVSEYITGKISSWEKIVKDDPAKLVLLEKQCALFEKAVGKYNKKRQELESKEKLISFVNPFRKKIEIIVNYPMMINHAIKIDVSREVFYDRLTTAADLEKLVLEAKEKLILVQVVALTSADGGAQETIPFTVVPKDLFKKVVQEPQVLFDPMDGQPRAQHLVVKVFCDDPDLQAVYSALFKAGEQKAIPHAYEQGFVAGKIAGHAEAIEKIQAKLICKK